MKSSRDYASRRSRYPTPYEPYPTNPNPYDHYPALARPQGPYTLPSPLPRDSYSYSGSLQLPPPLPRYYNNGSHQYHTHDIATSYYQQAPYSTSSPNSFGQKLTLYIGNVDYAATWKDLKDFIKSFGFYPLRVDVPFNTLTSRPKGFGIVEVNSREMMNDMINALNDKEFFGRRISVREDFKANKYPPSTPLQVNSSSHSGHLPRGPPPSINDPSCVLVLLDIPKNYAWQELKDLLRPIEPPHRVDVIKNSEDNSSVGIAEFSTKEQALNVIAFFKDAKVEDKEIRVLFKNDPDVPEFVHNPNSYKPLQGPPSRRLYVGQLAWTVTRSDLYDFFKQAGEVSMAQVVAEPNQYMKDGRPKSKGYGFIEFTTTEDAEKAIEMFNHKDFHGRSIQVRFDREDPSFVKY